MRKKLRKLKKFLRAHWPVITAAVVVAFVLYTQLRSQPIVASPELVFQRATRAPTATPTPTPTPRPTPLPTPLPTPRLILTTPTPQPIVAQINTERAAAGVSAVSSNGTLQRVAQEYAIELAAGQFLSHTSLQGVTFQDRIVRSGYIGDSAAENIAVTTRDGGMDVVEMWMNSSGHRANMLNSAFRAVGIGIATGLWQGVPATYVVAEFGSAR